MTRHPYGGDELDRDDPGLDRVAERLERHAAAHGGEPPPDLVARIQAAIDAEPAPRARVWASFTAGLRAWRAPARALAVAAVLVAAVVGALALGELANRARRDDIGASPAPTQLVTPSATPSVSPSPSDTESPSMSPTPTLAPSPTDDEDDDRVETPEPTQTDNSGPGGGGNSGPGGGGDNSGPGGGG